ncbi:endonuclease/exonuclease/phosphatase family protein [Proteiniphilum sp. UBA5310]|jgi:endonuclease/exonuclease/phosphatase family metal-dependent hydrolase|uniref:endonuclease/exonuclease/phosphatase family protein n=1 Tax=Proteiniphilum sp. UBA5310 TaxID=1947275 RepID=UPI00257ECA57|nr:endonuclease/exonuclease/phosphatase family protein [Proteiniphilum sp. UBA5310]
MFNRTVVILNKYKRVMRAQLKSIIHILFILLFLVSCSHPKLFSNLKSKSSTEFKIASYNIRCDVTSDIVSGNAWEIRKRPLADLIVNYDFDIVGIQEPYQNQLDDLQNMLKDYDYVWAPYATKSFLAIYYKKELFDVLDEGMFWLSETPEIKSMGWDADEYRIVHWAKFKHKETDKEFYCFNTHFYWKKITARQNSGPLSAKKIKEIAGDRPIIFLGDLNSQPTTSQIDSLKTVLNDVAEITQTPRKGPEKTAFRGGVFQGEPNSRIDYIFVSKDIKALDYTVYDDTYGEEDRYPSDHFPISSNIIIKGVSHELCK